MADRLGEGEGVWVAKETFLKGSWVLRCWELGFEASGPGVDDWGHERGERKCGELSRSKKGGRLRACLSRWGSVLLGRKSSGACSEVSNRATQAVAHGLKPLTRRTIYAVVVTLA